MKPEKFLASVFLFVIITLMLSVPARTVIFRASRLLEHDEESSTQQININWEELYPFESSDTNVPPPPIQSNYLLKLRQIYFVVKEKFDKRTSSALILYRKFVETAKLYESLIKWNIAYIRDYNPIIKLSDGCFTSFIPKYDVSHDAEATKNLAEYCKSLGIEFFYVNVPYKVCMHEDKNISGVLDFSNQNTNNFLELLETYGVKYYDLREILHSEGINHHEAFFIADHHWKPETGLWASKKILEFLKNDYNLDVDPEVLNPENFESVIYRDWFLGSQGKKVTLMQAQPEDIALLYPKYKTFLDFEYPSLGIKLSGDFQVTYNMKHIEPKDYYKLNCNAAYSYGSGPVLMEKNFLTGCDKKILFIRDSFCNTCLPFLVMGIKNIEALDIRDFPGSARNYIKSSKPDVVIVMYYSGTAGRSSKQDATREEKRCFDFR